MINKERICEKINEILTKEFGVNEQAIRPEASLISSLDLDSLDYVDLIVIVESTLGITITEADFEGIVTFQDFYDVVEQKITAKS